MELDYALPPASFEQSGQKVRNPSHIENSGLGTCFDLALLFCAALEQAGLNPLLVFTEGHAFAGVWLVREEFSTLVVEDVTALRKRLQLQELVLFETTLITERPTVSFRDACTCGAQWIDEAEEASFCLAVDIRQARNHGIKPLANVENLDQLVPSRKTAALDLTMDWIKEIPDLLEIAPAEIQSTGQCAPQDRLTQWQRKLLGKL